MKCIKRMRQMTFMRSRKNRSRFETVFGKLAGSGPTEDKAVLGVQRRGEA